MRCVLRCFVWYRCGGGGHSIPTRGVRGAGRGLAERSRSPGLLPSQPRRQMQRPMVAVKTTKPIVWQFTAGRKTRRGGEESPAKQNRGWGAATEGCSSGRGQGSSSRRGHTLSSQGSSRRGSNIAISSSPETSSPETAAAATRRLVRVTTGRCPRYNC